LLAHESGGSQRPLDVVVLERPVELRPAQRGSGDAPAAAGFVGARELALEAPALDRAYVFSDGSSHLCVGKVRTATPPPPAAKGRIPALYALRSATGPWPKESRRRECYLKRLIAPGVINTMPEQTLLAFAAPDAVVCTLSPQASEAEALLAGAAEEGLDLDQVTGELEREGVASFCDSDE
jgi:hypothetical protein